MLKRSKFRSHGAPKNFTQPHPGGAAKLTAWFADALARHQAGQLADAERGYNQILALRADHFDSRHLLGVIFLQRGNHAEALRHIDLALAQQPKHAAALNNRGVALKELGRLEEALASFDRAIAARPDYAEAHSNRANVLKQTRRFAEALASYDRALALRPNYAEAHSNRAAALHELKRFDDGLAGAERAIALRPDYAEAHCNRGNALHAQKRYTEALASYDRAIALQPNFWQAHCNRGIALYELFRYDEALASVDRSLALQPNFAEAHCNRGNVLQEMQRLDEAHASYDRAIALRPDFSEAYCNRGSAFKERQLFAEALADFDRATGVRPEFADAHFNAAHCLMLTGELERGWQQYEWRWETDQLKNDQRSFPQPQWRGSDELAGKTILVHAEQGLGDTLQFCRYVPRLAARGARVVLEVQRPLCDLMRTLRGGAQIVARGDPLPDFDLHCPLLSLPLAFGTTLETIPADVPYLFAVAAKTSAWQARLGAPDKPRVGLVWAGDPRKQLPNAHRVDRMRSLAFDQLAPIVRIADCDFYSLQKGEHAVAQLHESPLRHCVTDCADDLDDFSDTAALIDNLDLVIAVDTSVAHLAGALGKPFWLLNRYSTCWRWLLDRDDSPWYPTARLFRQDQGRSWDSVIERVAAALCEFTRR